MLQWEPPLFDQPFELWRDEGLLHLVLANGACLGTSEMKEVIRLIGAMDRGANSPVLIDHAPQVRVTDDARRLLARVCRAQGHPVAVYSTDRNCRAELDRFMLVERPRFPFKVCVSRSDAWHWARKRMQSRVMAEQEAHLQPSRSHDQ